MEVLSRLCIKSYSITAKNGDSFAVEQGKFYTTSKPKDGKVTVFSSFWVPVPADNFVARE